MPAKTLLSLSTGHLQASIWKDGVLSAEQHFPDHAPGRDQFIAFLRVNRNPIYLLTDFVEEDFHYETVPHLHGSDRRALLQRKFEQYYRSTPFRQALLQRRQKEGRRDDEILFCALTNPTLILPWLEILQQQCQPLAGIYSVPGISIPLIKGIACKHLLLLSWEKNAGLRQTYFDNNCLYFSRLTPVSNGIAFSDLINSETARTQQYLKSLGLLPQGDTLDALIICDAPDRHDMESNLPGNPNIRYDYLDIQQLWQRIGYRADQTGSDATQLFLHLLATNPPRSNYATSAHTHFFGLQQLRRGLLGLSAAFTAACLLWSAINIWDAGRFTADNELLKSQASQISLQAQQTISSLPGAASAAADMKTAVRLMRKLDNDTPPPQKILSELSAALNSYTHINIDTLSWQADSADYARTANDAAAPALPAQTILLSGKLQGLAGGPRSELNYLEHFQQELTQRGYSVSPLTLPLDVSSKGSINGDTMDNIGKTAQFSLKIIWRPTE